MLKVAEQSPVTALTPDERTELAELETVVEVGVREFYRVGRALARIRDGRLYREGHGTFEEYCQRRWEMARPSAYRYIDAASGLDGVSRNRDKIRNQTQALEVAAVPVERREVFLERSLETAPGGVLTAVHLRGVRLGMAPRGAARETPTDRSVRMKTVITTRLEGGGAWGRGESDVEKLAGKLRGFTREQRLLFLLMLAERAGHTQRWEVAGAVEAVGDVEAKSRSLRRKVGLD